MFRKFILGTTLAVFLLLFTHEARAQILDAPGLLDPATITVGTTTYEVDFPAPAFGNAESTIQNILFYLRNGFGFEQVEYQPAVYEGTEATSTPTVSNVYTDIADFAFSTPEQGMTQTARVVSAKTTCYTFENNFDIGDSAPEVREIQRFLNSDPDTQLATEGLGSPGEETEFFGAFTRNAVNAFQRKYASEVLNPLGLFQPTGFWGPSSRTKANELYGCE